jgi:hypothetical protein
MNRVDTEECVTVGRLEKARCGRGRILKAVKVEWRAYNTATILPDVSSPSDHKNSDIVFIRLKKAGVCISANEYLQNRGADHAERERDRTCAEGGRSHPCY